MEEAKPMPAGSEAKARTIARDLLLVCGIVSSLLYVGTDIAAAMRWQGYNYTAQAVSELMAIEAPTRPFMVPLFLAYDVLVMAFGVGLLVFAGTKRALRVTGCLILGYGAVGFVGLLFFPMHMRGTATSMTMTDTMHLISAGVIVVLILLFIGFGAGARGKWFRLYSAGTILLLMVFGAWAGFDASRMAAHLPTPWLGVKERINIYLSMLWVMALAISLWTAGKEPGQRNQ